MNAKKTKAIGYDGSLQMFRDPIHEPNIQSLRFLRWLAEQDRLEHAIAGPPAGEYADTVQG